MIYKTLSTVVDDFFAFCIKMPFLHRLACFRDDLVFLVFLYQVRLLCCDALEVVDKQTLVCSDGYTASTRSVSTSTGRCWWRMWTLRERRRRTGRVDTGTSIYNTIFSLNDYARQGAWRRPGPAPRIKVPLAHPYDVLPILVHPCHSGFLQSATAQAQCIPAANKSGSCITAATRVPESSGPVPH